MDPYEKIDKINKIESEIGCDYPNNQSYILKVIRSKSGTIIESDLYIIESLEDLKKIINQNRSPSQSNFTKQELIEKISNGQEVKDILNWALSTYVTFKKLSTDELDFERKELEQSLRTSINKLKPYILKTIRSQSGTIVESYLNIIESLDDLENVIDENRVDSQSNYTKQKLIEKISNGQEIQDTINWDVPIYVTFKKLSNDELEPERKELESSLQASINFFETQIDHIQEVISLNNMEN